MKGFQRLLAISGAGWLVLLMLACGCSSVTTSTEITDNSFSSPGWPQVTLADGYTHATSNTRGYVGQSRYTTNPNIRVQADFFTKNGPEGTLDEFVIIQRERLRSDKWYYDPIETDITLGNMDFQSYLTTLDTGGDSPMGQELATISDNLLKEYTCAVFSNTLTNTRLLRLIYCAPTEEDVLENYEKTFATID